MIFERQLKSDYLYYGSNDLEKLTDNIENIKILLFPVNESFSMQQNV